MPNKERMKQLNYVIKKLSNSELEKQNDPVSTFIIYGTLSEKKKKKIAYS